MTSLPRQHLLSLCLLGAGLEGTRVCREECVGLKRQNGTDISELIDSRGQGMIG